MLHAPHETTEYLLRDDSSRCILLYPSLSNFLFSDISSSSTCCQPRPTPQLVNLDLPGVNLTSPIIQFYAIVVLNSNCMPTSQTPEIIPIQKLLPLSLGFWKLSRNSVITSTRSVYKQLRGAWQKTRYRLHRYVRGNAEGTVVWYIYPMAVKNFYCSTDFF